MSMMVAGRGARDDCVILFDIQIGRYNYDVFFFCNLK